MSAIPVIPKKVRLVEVGPRDGLQNEKKVLGLEDKVRFIQELAQAGLKNIEATSFVRPDKIPQMGDAAELFSAVAPLLKSGISLPCLVPNLKGLEGAQSVGVKEIALFSATSDTFNQKNINATVDESLERLGDVASEARKSGIKLRGYVSTVFGCPYEGATSVEKLKYVAKKLIDFGCYDVSLGDTIGVGHPQQVREIISALRSDFDLSIFSMHFHDTRGLAVANVMASLEEGMSSFDSSAGGIGGCPYAKGASGNVATEDLLYLFESLGIETGVDRTKVFEASAKILKLLGKSSLSKVHLAMERELGKS